MTVRDENGWPGDAFQALLELDVRLVTYVPDAGHARLIDMCAREETMTTVPLTSEEEGVAVLAGAWLGGRRGVLLMQGSGIGNCVNTLSFVRTCRFPLLIIATMRGQEGEFNPWQMPMGGIAGAVLGLAGVGVHEAADAATVGPAVASCGQAAFAGPAAMAVLIAQGVVGVKDFRK